MLSALVILSRESLGNLFASQRQPGSAGCRFRIGGNGSQHRGAQENYGARDTEWRSHGRTAVATVLYACFFDPELLKAIGFPEYSLIDALREKIDFPQWVKPIAHLQSNGTAEAGPLQSLVLQPVLIAGSTVGTTKDALVSVSPLPSFSSSTIPTARAGDDVRSRRHEESSWNISTPN